LLAAIHLVLIDLAPAISFPWMSYWAHIGCIPWLSR
jgi:hypothetical protein